jgi:hypothetical protein
MTWRQSITRKVDPRLADRRRFLRWATRGTLGLSLPLLLRLSERTAAAAPLPGSAATAGRTPRIKSCIVVFYYGGPSHIDTLDMKPQAPAEVRGEFQPIATSVPGLSICEHLPHLARVMHRVTLVRSLHHAMRLHDAACVVTHTGRPPARGDGEFFAAPPDASMHPVIGAALTHVRAAHDAPVPHAALPFVINNVVPVPCQSGGFLGASCDPFRIFGDPDTLAYRAESLALAEGLSLERIGGRGDLLSSLDAAQGGVPAEAAAPLRGFYQKAVDLLSSQAVRRALDVSQEDERTRDRYGRGAAGQSFQDGPNGDNGAHLGIGRNMRGQNLLLARRLVEAGVPFVNVFDFKQQGKNWDAHKDNFNQHKDHLLPPADQALAALIEDLQERGLLESTLVVALGEFGRTPQINRDAGRDHWPDCYTALVAGGGVRGGYVYGASDRLGAYPDRDPVTPGDLAATIFDAFGIDPATEIHDLANRPHRLADGQPMRDLFA